MQFAGSVLTQFGAAWAFNSLFEMPSWFYDALAREYDVFQFSI